MILTKLSTKAEISGIYEIYKHCMYMPSPDKFNKKVDLWVGDRTISVLAFTDKKQIKGVIVLSFLEQNKAEIIGIAVDETARNKGIGTYMINTVINEFNLSFLYAETDKDAVVFYHKNGFRILEFCENLNDETVTRYKCEKRCEKWLF